MSQQSRVDWNDASKQYQSSVGAISGHTAFELVDMAQALSKFSEQSTILDAGCGPGAVTLVIATKFPDARIEAVDTSQKMLDDLKANITKLDQKSAHVSTRTVDIHDLESTYGDAAFSHVFASLVLHVAAKDYVDSMRQIYKILKPGGIFAYATFTPHSDPYLIWDRVCRIFDPDYEQASFAPDPDAWKTPGQVGAGFQKAGFVDVKSVVRRNPFPFSTTEAWVDFFFTGQNPASERIKQPFFDTHDIPVEKVREIYTKILKEEWDGGQNILAEFVLAVGRKPN